MNQPNFMHYRALDLLGTVSCLGGATVAIEQLEDTNRAIVSIAYCSGIDHFNKQIGRSVSQGRLKSYLSGKPNPHVFEIDIPEHMGLKEAVALELRSTMSELDLY